MGVAGNISFDKIAPGAAPNASLFFAAAAIAAAGAITLAATKNDIPRRVAAVSTNSGDTTQTLTITGTPDAVGVATISETITLNGTTAVYTKQDFYTVTAIKAGGTGYPTAGNITIGQNQVASTPWRVVNTLLAPFAIGFFAHVVSGVLSYTVEQTMDDPNIIPGIGSGFGSSLEPSSYNPPLAIPDQSSGQLILKAADGYGTLLMPVFAYRLTLNTYTYSAGIGVTLQGIQAGLHN